MKRKYKRLPKAAYIDYEEDYCSNAVLRDNRPIPAKQLTHLALCKPHRLAIGLDGKLIAI